MIKWLFIFCWLLLSLPWNLWAISSTARFSLTLPRRQLSIWTNCRAEAWRNCLNITLLWHWGEISHPTWMIMSTVHVLEQSVSSDLLPCCHSNTKRSQSLQQQSPTHLTRNRQTDQRITLTFLLTLEMAACPRMSSGDVGSSIQRGLNSARLDTQRIASATSHLWLASII